MQRNLAHLYSTDKIMPANDAPLPLKRIMQPGAPYPVLALGSLMGDAVLAAADIIHVCQTCRHADRQ